jgi:hypothetical protein
MTYSILCLLILFTTCFLQRNLKKEFGTVLIKYIFLLYRYYYYYYYYYYVLVTTPHLRLFLVCLFTFCINVLFPPGFPCKLFFILCCACP